MGVLRASRQRRDVAGGGRGYLALLLKSPVLSTSQLFRSTRPQGGHEGGAMGKRPVLKMVLFVALVSVIPLFCAIPAAACTAKYAISVESTNPKADPGWTNTTYVTLSWETLGSDRFKKAVAWTSQYGHAVDTRLPVKPAGSITFNMSTDGDGDLGDTWMDFTVVVDFVCEHGEHFYQYAYITYDGIEPQLEIESPLYVDGTAWVVGFFTDQPPWSKYVKDVTVTLDEQLMDGVDLVPLVPRVQCVPSWLYMAYLRDLYEWQSLGVTFTPGRAYIWTWYFYDRAGNLGSHGLSHGYQGAGS